MILAEIIFEKDKGVKKISLVKSPAIEVDFLKFKQEKELKFNINEDKQVVTGAVLIPNKNYYRSADYFQSENNEAGYVFFTKDTVRNLGIDWLKNGQNSINLEHKDDLQPNDMDLVESWFIENDTDKAYSLGFSKEQVPVGSWMMSQHVNNNDLWQEVKKGTFNGFSLQGFLAKNIIGTGLDLKKEFTEDEIANIIAGLCMADETTVEIKITTGGQTTSNIIDTNAPVTGLTGNTPVTSGKVTANANSGRNNISGDTNSGTTTGTTGTTGTTSGTTTGTTGTTGGTNIKMSVNDSVTTSESDQNIPTTVKDKKKYAQHRASDYTGVTDNDLMKAMLQWKTPEERASAVKKYMQRLAQPEQVQLSKKINDLVLKLGAPDNMPNTNNYDGSAQIVRSLDKVSKKKQNDSLSRAIDKKKAEDKAQADATEKAKAANTATLSKIKNKGKSSAVQAINIPIAKRK